MFGPAHLLLFLKLKHYELFVGLYFVDTIFNLHNSELLYDSRLGSPNAPSINGNSQMTEGTTRQLSCDATGAYPQGDIKWYINGNDVTQTPASTTMNSDNRYDIRSTLSYNPRRENNGQSLKCKATHESGDVETTQVLDIQCKCYLHIILSDENTREHRSL